MDENSNAAVRLVKKVMLIKAYTRLKMDTNTKSMWPELKMATLRGQQEFDFVVKLGHMVLVTDRSDLADLSTVQQPTARAQVAGVQVFVGQTESWDMAKRICKAQGTFLDEMKEVIEEAQKESKSSWKQSWKESPQSFWKKSPGPSKQRDSAQVGK